MRSQRNRTQLIEVGGITPVSIGIRQQSIRFRQVIFAFCPVPHNSRVFLTNLLIVEYRRIAAVDDIAQQTKCGIDVEMHRQKLISAPHLSHSYQIIKTQHLGTPGKTNLAHTPHIVADHHVSPHELKTLALRHKTDTELTVVRFTHYGVYIIGIEFLCIGSQRGEQLIIQQGGRVDIDVEVFKQTAVQFPKFGRSTHTGFHFLVVNIGSGIMQFAVCLHHILPDPFLHTEHGRDKAEQVIFLADVCPAFDIKFRLVLIDNALVKRRKEDNLVHNGIRISPLSRIRLGNSRSTRLLQTCTQETDSYPYTYNMFQPQYLLMREQI